jgi:hypothetical protein
MGKLRSKLRWTYTVSLVGDGIGKTCGEVASSGEALQAVSTEVLPHRRMGTIRTKGSTT